MFYFTERASFRGNSNDSKLMYHLMTSQIYLVTLWRAPSPWLETTGPNYPAVSDLVTTFLHLWKNKGNITSDIWSHLPPGPHSVPTCCGSPAARAPPSGSPSWWSWAWHAPRRYGNTPTARARDSAPSAPTDGSWLQLGNKMFIPL